MHGIRPGTRKQASKSPITPKRFCRSPAGREIYRVGGLIKSVEAKKICRSVADWRVGWAGCIFSAARQNYLESGGCRVKSLHTPLLLCLEHAPITGSASHNPAWTPHGQPRLGSRKRQCQHQRNSGPCMLQPIVLYQGSCSTGRTG